MIQVKIPMKKEMHSPQATIFLCKDLVNAAGDEIPVQYIAINNARLLGKTQEQIQSDCLYALKGVGYPILIGWTTVKAGFCSHEQALNCFIYLTEPN